ncbi:MULTISPECIES: hypothetical protein [Saliphagus]|uniref:Uncharacterized protein n=1 Tax=Saliphagus infecundisoli TaxID=1849069 RepID=A0ABD5QIS2_9EURY|nr:MULTISPECIES: hypothetical protein [Saliphagus]
MNPARVDFVVDLIYGLLIFASIALIAVLGTRVGVAFGLGVLASYVVHVVWKMARFDPDWMTREVADEVEETVTEEVTEEVEQTVSQEVDEVIDRLEEINDRVDRRPRTEEVDERVEELTRESRPDDGSERDR